MQQELSALGIQQVQVQSSGVSFPYSIENVYLANYCSRIAIRVLVPLLRFPCRDREALYRGASSIEWERYLTPQSTFSIDANIQQTPAFKNSHFASLVVKDALCDQMRSRTGERPSVDTKNPTLQLNLFIQRGEATLYIDSSGAALYKRGWRSQTAEAPLQETLAAALLRAAGYTREDILFDPFCGSGTLLVEAALIATQTPPGYFRKQWGFQGLPEYTEENWLIFKSQQDAKRISLPKDHLIGADIAPAMIDHTYQNLVGIGLDKSITLLERGIDRLRHPVRPTLIMTNPPYGIRLSQQQDLFSSLSAWLQKQPQARSFLLYPEEGHLEKQLGLPCTPIVHFYNGSIPTCLYRIS